MPLSLDQLARRRSGIGGSEIAAVAGLNPDSSPIEVWQQKCEPPTPRAPSEAMKRGDFLEPGLREWYAYDYDRSVTESDTLVHHDHDIVMATPDGISQPAKGDGDTVLLEIKSPGQHRQADWGESGTDQIPLYYLPQVTWTMAVTRLPSAHVVALVYGELRVYRVPYSPELFAELLEVGTKFWERHVIKRQPPPVDGSKAYAEYLARKFKVLQADSELEAGQKEEFWMLRLAQALRNKKKIEFYIERAKNHIKEAMGTSAKLVGSLGTCTWRHKSDSTHVDWKAVAQELGATDSIIEKHTQLRPGPREFRNTLKLADDGKDDGVGEAK